MKSPTPIRIVALAGRAIVSSDGQDLGQTPNIPDPSGSMLEDAPKYLSGDVIASKYRLTSLIGEGGMGAVWLAKNLTLDADVCVKLIRRDVATPKASARLLQEARAAARLSHPSIVRVFDFGETEHRDPFIVMELLRGDSLRRLIARKARLPAANAVATLLPVAGALAEAHSKGVVHRDLKPENIVLVVGESGSVIPKVVDFGVAKVRHDDHRRGLTQDGSVLGSPDYMSPEQAQGQGDLDERSDVWAFSVVLYELLVGRLPFTGENYNALLWSIQREPPLPTTSFAAGDAELWGIIERGLQKDRGARWESMRAMGTALATWAVSHGVDVDATGSSVELGWLSGSRRPLSEAPATRLRAPSFADSEGGAPGAGEAAERNVRTEPEPERRAPRRSVASAGAGLALLGAVGIGAWFWTQRDHSAPALGVQSPNHPPSTVSVATTGNAAAESSVDPAPVPLPGAPPVPQPLPPVAAPSGSTALACVAPLFADGTFSEPSSVDLGFLCTETDPRAGAQQLKMQVVKSRGVGVSAGMQEWAQLSWYQMAAFALARGRCCPSPPRLVLPSTDGACEPLEGALEELGRVSSSGRDARAAVDRFDETVMCLFKKGGAARYSYPLVRLGDARAVFDKTLSRASGADAAAR